MRRCLLAARATPNASLMPLTTKLASHRLPFLFLSTSIPTSTPCSATQPKSRRKDLRCTRRQTISLPLCPTSIQGSFNALLQHTPLPYNPFFSLQVTTNQPRPRPKAFPSARTHFSLLAYHSGPRIRAQSLPSPIKPATASQTPRPASIHSAYPLNLASFATPQQIEILRRALSSPAHASRATRLKPYRASRISASCGVYLCLGRAQYFRASACRAWNPFVRRRWKWRTRLELQCHTCVGSLSRA